MKKILILAAFAAAPLSAASAQDHNPVEAFINSVTAGSPLVDSDFQPAVSDDTRAKLRALKGCKRETGKVLKDGRFAMTWKCRRHADGPIQQTIIAMSGAKITQVEVAAVDGGYDPNDLRKDQD